MHLEVLKWMEENAPDALLLEPRDVYDVAIIGRTCEPKDHWPRDEPAWVFIYDAELCIEAIQTWMDCDYDEAVTWFDFNVCGGWCSDPPHPHSCAASIPVPRSAPGVGLRPLRTPSGEGCAAMPSVFCVQRGTLPPLWCTSRHDP